MDTLLTFNDDAALIGDMDGRVRTEVRSDELSSEKWAKRLRHDYNQPKHGYKDQEGTSFMQDTLDHRFEDGQMIIGREGFKLYETFSDKSFGLSIRATFLPNLQCWVVADREQELDDEAESS